MTKEQLYQNLEYMASQKAPQEDVQKVIDIYNAQDKKETGEDTGMAPKDPDGFQRFLMGAVKPLHKVGASGAIVLEGAALLGAKAIGQGDSQFAENRREDIKILADGVDVGASPEMTQKIRPFGSSFASAAGEGMGVGEKITRTAADTIGTGLEIGSYALAPIAGAVRSGFWKTVIQSPYLASKFAGAMGAGVAGQAVGEGKSGGQAALEGAGTFIGASLAYGVTAGGARLFGNWGAKLLQSDAVKIAGSRMKDLAEKVWTALPETFQAGSIDLAKTLTGRNTRRAYNALADEYASNHRLATDAITEAARPKIDNKPLDTLAMQRALGDTIGQKFEVKKQLYAEASPIEIGPMGNSLSNLEKLGGPDIPQGRVKYEDVIKATEQNPTLREFKIDLQRSMTQNGKPKNLTVGDTFDLYQKAMSYLPRANPAEKEAIRNFANGLYREGREILGKTNPEGLATWDGAYKTWQEATDLYESNVLSKLRTVGDVDTFVDKMLDGGMTRPEETVLRESMTGNEELLQNLFIDSVLRKAQRATSPEDGAKIIDSFLDKWGDPEFSAVMEAKGMAPKGLLSPGQVKQLSDISEFMKSNFDDFITGQRSLVVPPETGVSTDLLKGQKTQAEIGDFVNKRDFNGLVDYIATIKNPDELVQKLSVLKPEEQKLVGLSYLKNVFDEKQPLFDFNKNGTVDMTGYAESIKSALIEINKFGGSRKKEIGGMLFSPEQEKSLADLNKVLNSFDSLNEVSVAGVKKILYSVVGVIHASMGHPGGAIMSFGKAATSGGASKEYADAINTLFSSVEGKNTPLKVGTFLEAIAPIMGKLTGKGTDETIKALESVD